MSGTKRAPTETLCGPRGRKDREALRAEARTDREHFERHIIRLTEQQGTLAGNLESIRDQLATTQ